jgi:hypothetical protein
MMCPNFHQSINRNFDPAADREPDDVNRKGAAIGVSSTEEDSAATVASVRKSQQFIRDEAERPALKHATAGARN